MTQLTIDDFFELLKRENVDHIDDVDLSDDLEETDEENEKLDPSEVLQMIIENQLVFMEKKPSVSLDEAQALATLVYTLEKLEELE